MNKSAFILLFIALMCMVYRASAQYPIALGDGSYASYAPLSESRSAEHEGCQAYYTEHRRLYLPDSLLDRLSASDGSRQGTLALPTNDWWTYALVNTWTGKLWFYPGWAEATENGVEIGFPSYWEPTGCEVKWDTPLSISFRRSDTGKKASFSEALIDGWSDFMVSFIMQDESSWVRVTCMQGSPIVWVEASGISIEATNPDDSRYAVMSQSSNGTTVMAIGLMSEGLTASEMSAYAFRIPRKTAVDYSIRADQSVLDTYFRIYSQDTGTGSVSQYPCIMAFLPHHYFSAEDSPALAQSNSTMSDITYLSPRGRMKVAVGNDFKFSYPIHGMLPFFPAPIAWKEGFSAERMKSLTDDYATKGTFGADTYWGGKGLTQMMHYMSFALQMNDTATYRLAKQRLKSTLIDWFTYTPGEQNRYFARFPRFGALVGFDPSYDSDTFNDHHFHYGYFIYSAAVLCMLDDDFRTRYGAMAREVALDYASWLRDESRYPRFRTFNPYCGHSFAGGMGNQGNGNGQESSSESMQAWGGIWMLGAALSDEQMMNAGIYGYTVEAKATAEYWFDRKRRNIDYTKYTHPYCCNLTMQGVGWWTWFSGDPVWMHSIQWLPISPILTNYLSADTAFARWDYTQMYAGKHIGNYEAASGGLGDESGLGNVCLSYLAMIDADSAARVWDRMDQSGKAIARNTDTGGITYWLAHAHRSLGEKRYDIYSDYMLSCAYSDTTTGVTTYAAYNTKEDTLAVHFYGAKDTTILFPDKSITLIMDNGQYQSIRAIADDSIAYSADSMAWSLPYPNIALHKSVTASSSENAGTQPANLTDGEYTSRWGSSHRDNEYATIDLGQIYYIDHLVLRWEAAYASRYAIALSDDKTDWHQVEINSSGGVETVALAQLMAGIQSPSRGRYIRLIGLERATTYGTSIYELEAYGRPIASYSGQLFVIALAASDTIVMQGQSVSLSTSGYDAAGNIISVSPTLAITSGTAVLNGTQLTCTHPGSVTITASTGQLSSSLTIQVMETEQATQTIVTPDEVTMPLGEQQSFVVSELNQFGTTMDTCVAIFRATQVGDTTLIFECFEHPASAIAHVLPYDQVNLALSKPVQASGSENNGTTAMMAVDGLLSTRWSSRFQDNEWIVIDLLQCYLLKSVKLYWENAYATAYDIELSDDGVNFTPVYSVSNAQGGNQTIDLSSNGQPTPAQYVKLICKKRNTNYGASLWEIEVFGQSACDTISTALPTVARQDTDHKFIINGHLYIQHHTGQIFDAMGRPVNK